MLWICCCSNVDDDVSSSFLGGRLLLPWPPADKYAIGFMAAGEGGELIEEDNH